MSETVQINLNVTDNGTTAKANAEAAKLRANYEGAQRAAASTKAFAASAAARPASSALGQASDDSNMSRGVGGVTGAAGRDFAAQAQGLGGLVHVYATFAANLFAVTAAFSALSKAADVTNMVKGLDQLGATSGQALGSMAKHLTVLTDGAISLKDAMTATAQATAGGLSGDQLSRLTVVAKNASQALGRDMPDALSRLTRGIVKIEPELLDELGIMTRVDKAQQDYARSLGKTATSLSDFEKRQAFATAAIAEGEKKFGSIQIDANPYSKLLASMTNLAIAGAELANKVLGPVAKILSESPTALAAVMAGIVGLLVSKAIPALGQWRDGLIKSAEVYKQLADKKLTDARSADVKLAEHNKAAAERMADTELKVWEDAEKKLATLKTSSKVKGGKVASEIIGRQDVSSVTDAELAHLEKVAKQQKTRNPEVAKTYDQLASSIRNARDAQVAYGTASAQHTAALSKQQSAVSTYTQLKLIADDANRKYISRLAVSSAVETTAVEGPIAGFKKLHAEIQKTRQTMESGASGVGLLGTSFNYLKGTIGIATTAITTFVNAFGWITMVIGVAIAAFQILDGALSKNGKQVAEFSSSVDTLNDSFLNVDRTMAVIAKKDALGQINAVSIQASATALKELSDNLIKVSEGFKEVDKYASGWDKAWDWTKDIFGKGSQDKLSEGMGKAVDKALSTISDPARKAAATKSIQALFGGNVDVAGTNIKKMMQELDSPEALAMAEKITKEIQSISHASSNAASAQVEFINAMEKSSKAATDLSNSYMPTDKVSVMLMAQVVALDKLTLASTTSEGAMTSLTEAVSSLQRISAFPPELATALIEHKKDIESIGSEYASARVGVLAYTDALNSLVEKQEELDKRKKKLATNWKGSEAKAISTEQENLNQDKKVLESNKASSEATISRTKQAMEDIQKQYAPLISKSLMDAYNTVNKLVEQAGEKAALNYAKAINSLIPGGGSAEEATRLAHAEISMQERMLASDREMITAMDKLGAQYALAVASQDMEKYSGNKNSEEYKSAEKSKEVATSTLKIIGLSSKELNSYIQLAKDSKDPESLQMVQKATELAQKKVGLEVKSVELAGQHAVISLQGAISLLKQQEANISAEMELSKARNTSDLNSLEVLTSYSSLYNDVVEQQKLALKLRINDTDETKAQLALDMARQQVGTLEKAGASGSDMAQAKNKLNILEQQLIIAKQVRVLADNKAEQENDRAKLASLKFIRDENAKIADLQLNNENSNIELAKKQLESTNSLYTLNQEMYNAELRDLDLKAEKLRYNNELSKLENRKADVLDPKQTQLDRLESSIDPQAATQAALLRTEIDLLKLSFEAEGNALNIANQNKLASIEIDSRAREETRAMNELLAAQASLVESLTVVFGDLGTSLGKVAQGFFDMSKKQDSLDKGRSASIRKSTDEYIKAYDKVDASEEERNNAKNKYIKDTAIIEKKYQSESLKNELSGFASIIGGAKSMFNEKSAGYKILGGIEKALHIAKLGMLFAENAANIATLPAKISAGVANMFATLGPFGFAAVAAMMAVMAAVGFSGGGISVPSIPEEATAEYQQKMQGTGTVLGDSTAKSNSIAESIDIMAEHSFEMLDFNQEMLTSLNNIDRGINGLSSSLAKVAGITGIAGTSPFGTVNSSSSSPGFLGWGAKSTSTEIVNTGVLIKGSLNQLATNIGSTVTQFETVAHSWTKSKWFSSSSGVDINTNTQDITDKAGKDIALIFGSMQESIHSGLLVLGNSAEETARIMGILDKLPIDLSVSLQGLKGSEITDAINGVFSAAFDKMALEAQPWLVSVQKVNEGIGQTFMRIAADSRNLNLALEAAGMGIDRFTTQFNETFTQGFASQAQLTAVSDAKIAKAAAEKRLQEEKDKDHQSVLINDGESMYITWTDNSKNIATAQENLTSTTKDLTAAETALGTATMTSVNARALAEQYLLDGAGGADAFISKMDFFTEQFKTDSEKLAPSIVRIGMAMSNMNPKVNGLTGSLPGLGAALKDTTAFTDGMAHSLPMTKSGFNDLMNSINMTTPAGADLTNILLNLAPAFDAVMQAIEDIDVTVADLTKRTQDMKFEMEYALKDTAGKYAMLNKVASDLNTQMRDPTASFSEQANSANQLLDTINKAWSLMSPEQQIQYQKQYFEKIDGVQQFIKEQGLEAKSKLTPDGNAITDKIDTTNDKLSDGFDRVVEAVNGVNLKIKSDADSTANRAATIAANNTAQAARDRITSINSTGYRVKKTGTTNTTTPYGLPVVNNWPSSTGSTGSTAADNTANDLANLLKTLTDGIDAAVTALANLTKTSYQIAVDKINKDAEAYQVKLDALRPRAVDPAIAERERLNALKSADVLKLGSYNSMAGNTDWMNALGITDAERQAKVTEYQAKIIEWDRQIASVVDAVVTGSPEVEAWKQAQLALLEATNKLKADKTIDGITREIENLGKTQTELALQTVTDKAKEYRDGLIDLGQATEANLAVIDKWEGINKAKVVIGVMEDIVRVMEQIASFKDGIGQAIESIKSSSEDYNALSYLENAKLRIASNLAAATTIEDKLKYGQELQENIVSRFNAALELQKKDQQARMDDLHKRQEAEQKASNEAIDALNKQGELGVSLNKALTDLSKFARELTQAFSTPTESVQLLKQKYLETIDATHTTDLADKLEALGKVEGDAKAYVDAAKSTARNREEYARLVATVQTGLLELGEEAERYNAVYKTMEYQDFTIKWQQETTALEAKFHEEDTLLQNKYINELVALEVLTKQWQLEQEVLLAEQAVILKGIGLSATDMVMLLKSLPASIAAIVASGAKPTSSGYSPEKGPNSPKLPTGSTTGLPTGAIGTGGKIMFGTEAITSMYQEYLGRAPEAAGLTYWTDLAASGASMASIEQGIATSLEANKLRGFASGGLHEGGLRLVGENGPELEATGASRIFNRGDTSNIFKEANAELVAEIKELRKELEKQKEAIMSIAASSKSTKDTLIRVTRDGQAMVTTV